MTEFGRYFVPGPVEVHPDVLAALTRPVIPHRSAETEELFRRTQPGLQAVFGTTRPVYVLTSSGTAVVEAGLRALPRGKVLALVNGAFSQRFERIARECGHDVDVAGVDWGEVHDPAAVAAGRARRRLPRGHGRAQRDVHRRARAHRGDRARARRRAPSGRLGQRRGRRCRRHGRRGPGVRVHGRAEGARASARPRIRRPLREDAAGRAAGPARGYYLDLLRYDKDQPPFTPAISLVFALAAQLERMEKEGLAARFARHQAMAERTWDWVETAGDRIGVALEVLAPAGARSPTVTCVKLPAGHHGPDAVRRIAERGYTVGAGYAVLKETTFRIGHMGEQTLATLEGLLAACDEALAAP